MKVGYHTVRLVARATKLDLEKLKYFSEKKIETLLTESAKYGMSHIENFSFSMYLAFSFNF